MRSIDDPRLPLVRLFPEEGYVIATKNKILGLLSAQDCEIISPYLERTELKRDQVLFEPLEPIEYVYFFEGGLSSEIVVNPDGNGVEVGCIGFEGFAGVPVVLGLTSTPHKSFMQAAGQALRIRPDDLRRAMATSPSLTSLLLRYAHVFMVQVAATALMNGRYHIEQRLARWLLMCDDRLGVELPLTHEFLALMLGVRRPSVTDSLHVLEGQQLITATRGRITIRNRRRLEEAAGEAYGMSEREYRRILTDTWPSLHSPLITQRQEHQ
ncbi:Crp/Fnr family transcriptional regulator [Rhizobium deserti]|uniref:Crp/Fnr family transcriptional regulator n=2 Tax=Rhizobium deserti TaxID=2547961 RepID=A0A4R5UL05_9HYPH|nr:Crp/Fnr family transcriptional regulator [Rhizobium deserti]